MTVGENQPTVVVHIFSCTHHAAARQLFLSKGLKSPSSGWLAAAGAEMALGLHV